MTQKITIENNAQEFCRIVELAVADDLPCGKSNYKILKIKGNDGDIVLWEVVEREVASRLSQWPEWAAILDKIHKNKASEPTSPKKTSSQFNRYNKVTKETAAPAEFKTFDKRFKSTSQSICEYTLNQIKIAVSYSVERFENSSDYQNACQALQREIDMQKLDTMSEALPLRDIWKPTQLVEEAIIPEILSRISEEVEYLKNIRTPYDGKKPCAWNLTMMIRLQVQLLKTLRDRVSRLIAVAESQFQGFFINEILQAEILPLVRSNLSNKAFLASIAKT